MCGIVGFLCHSASSAVVDRDAIERAIGSLRHRGPDDADVWVDADAGIALGHTRLSVLDLSSAGRQPMLSAAGRFVLVFNGEIYNHLEIRDELAHAQPRWVWRGHSDTETLLAGFECWGVERVLKKTVGMFAFALWDRQERTLTLARDRIGEKPLYYGWQGGIFLFGSELKALRRHPAFRAGIDRNALAMYMRRGYVVAPYSIYRDIFKLLPGSYLKVSAADPSGTGPSPRRYWSLKEVVERGVAQPFLGSDVEAIDELEFWLKQAVRQQSVADVPLGAFLSGGTDSSAVVALMQAQSLRPIKTFTIGFNESAYQEAAYAQSVARHLRTDHTELYVTSREAMEVIPKLPELYDEPFGDSSAIPTFLVSQLARQQVTVSLSGDGGDELFGGYTRYQRTNDLWRVLHHIPYGVRNALAHGIGAIWRGGGSKFGSKADRLARYLSAKSAQECYGAQTLQNRARNFVLGAGEGPLGAGDALDCVRLPDSHLHNAMMYTDAMTYLPDDILVKVDRASMGVSLESRVPMLDHRVVEFAWRVPLHMKVRNRQSKWLLKQVLRKYVPTSLTERPKMGFGVPVSEWIRGSLSDWAESLLAEDRLDREGFLDSRQVRQQWSRHLAGTATEGDGVWQVLMFQAWLASVRP